MIEVVGDRHAPLSDGGGKGCNTGTFAELEVCNALSKSPKVYFFCCNDEGNLQEDVISLAEGLRELGVTFYSNCDYWRQSQSEGDFLLKHNPGVSVDDCDVAVVSYTWPFQTRAKYWHAVRRPLPGALFKKGRLYKTVYMDHHDGHRTVSWDPEFRQFDFIFRCKLNRRAFHPQNLRPWTLGLNQRVLSATANAPQFEQRRRTILVNFGASHPYSHGARVIAKEHFEPLIKRILSIDRTKDDLSREPEEPYAALMWRQTGQRFSQSYYERLKQSQAVACFCGELIPPMPFSNPECYLVGGNKARLRRHLYEFLGLFDPRPRRSVQWDSFRFWEALAAGCTAFNIDLDLYGVELPVMPINGRHYIGVDFNRPEKFLDLLTDGLEVLKSIATEGRRWALEHYAPRAMARRFLRIVSPTAEACNA
jgi:hypothetical protein